MPITESQIIAILPRSAGVAKSFVPALNVAMGKYQIVTQFRIAAFLAQIGHESAQLTALVENLNYSATALQKTWPNRFTPELAAQYARQPERIANVVYGSRMGNTGNGDGWKYRGRGLIQLTGKTNYQQCGEALGVDLLGQPELLETPEYAALAAGWFWSVNGLNTLADNGDFIAITKRINGGTNGLADRQALYEKALKVLA
ncbi:glycoside hydrolase family 19 protein [Pseudomonas sp. CDFA 602]|uniref:glycoside hydrolase family 19 protein n=1 Tax=Pseudomonas californiensis TaxID=2829823 RepID=UPI001E310358|nr:glycoside hydrolase family 19 protein [Pseudomonas californiensis]MCD5994132.1 glycoside hydrolase family 19 protein [Pseudomonas californiensis]MCD5999769.1 glycoside hydrolase family 19 protein [Pseudomonas californiensis]